MLRKRKPRNWLNPKWLNEARKKPREKKLKAKKPKLTPLLDYREKAAHKAAFLCEQTDEVLGNFRGCAPDLFPIIKFIVANFIRLTFESNRGVVIITRIRQPA